MWKGGRWLVRRSWRGRGSLGMRNRKGEEGTVNPGKGKVQDLEAQVSVEEGRGD